MGDIRELGNIVAGAFAHPDEAGNGEHLPLVGDFMSFNEIVDTLNRQGHKFSFKQVPTEVFAISFPGAAEVAATFRHFQAHTYLGSDSHDQIAFANKIAGRQPTGSRSGPERISPPRQLEGNKSSDRMSELPDDVLELQQLAFGYFLDHTNAKNGLVADNTREDSPCSIAARGWD